MVFMATRATHEDFRALNPEQETSRLLAAMCADFGQTTYLFWLCWRRHASAFSNVLSAFVPLSLLGANALVAGASGASGL